MLNKSCCLFKFCQLLTWSSIRVTMIQIWIGIKIKRLIRIGNTTSHGRKNLVRKELNKYAFKWIFDKVPAASWSDGMGTVPPS